MEIKVQYSTLEEREALILQYVDKVLIEEQNLLDGNYLIFGDEPRPTIKIYTQIDEEELNTIKLALAELAETHEQTKLETQLALAELAETIVGGE